MAEHSFRTSARARIKVAEHSFRTSARARIAKNKHSASIQQLFYSMLARSVLFFLITELSILMVVVFYYEKCMFKKVTMKRTPQYADFSLLSKDPS